MNFANKVWAYLNKPVMEVVEDVASAGKALLIAAGVGTAAMIAPQPSYAVTDYSTLTTAVDWTAVGVALLAVGAAIIGIFVIFKGIKLVVKAVKGA